MVANFTSAVDFWLPVADKLDCEASGIAKQTRIKKDRIRIYRILHKGRWFAASSYIHLSMKSLKNLTTDTLNHENESITALIVTASTFPRRRFYKINSCQLMGK